MKVDNINLATIIHTGEGEYDGLLRDFVEELKADGVNVQGLLTKHYKNPMIIYDISSNQEFVISQTLGKNSTSCCLDLGKLAGAAFVLRKGLEEKPDLVIINRFGTAEAEGGGFIEELQALIGEDIPVLTLTADKYLDAWQTFTGGLAEEVAPNKEALHAWFNKVRG